MIPAIDARQLIREGRTAEALAAAKAAHERAPGDTEARLVLGIAYALNEQASPARPGETPQLRVCLLRRRSR